VVEAGRPAEEIVDQIVEVPVEVRTWPVVPEVPVTSRRAAVRDVVASVVVPERLAAPEIAKLVDVADVNVADVAMRFVKMAVRA
jgi:hypothetical protein